MIRVHECPTDHHCSSFSTARFRHFTPSPARSPDGPHFSFRLTRRQLDYSILHTFLSAPPPQPRRLIRRYHSIAFIFESFAFFFSFLSIPSASSDDEYSFLLQIFHFLSFLLSSSAIFPSLLSDFDFLHRVLIISHRLLPRIIFYYRFSFSFDIFIFTSLASLSMFAYFC